MAKKKYDADKYNRKQRAIVNGCLKRINKIFEELAKDAARMAASMPHGITNTENYVARHPSIQKELEKLVSKALEAIKQQIETHEDTSWMESERKNDALVASFVEKSSFDIPQTLLDKWTDKQHTALTAFRERKQGGLGLSERVWNMKPQMMEEMAMCIELSIGSGQSAASLSREIRKYLNEPSKLFRRVRDKYGVLRLSKAANAYHPGRGVYRSSYKNAIRLAGTEINMAYRTADHHRWNQIDFVTGMLIKVSHNSHPCKDICDDLQGFYPKEFLWTGWHPQCRCAATPEVPSSSDFLKYLKMELDGGDVSNYNFTGVVKDVPESFKKWFEENGERIARASSIPYFIKDNVKFIPPKWQEDIKNAIGKNK